MTTATKCARNGTDINGTARTQRHDPGGAIVFAQHNSDIGFVDSAQAGNNALSLVDRQSVLVAVCLRNRRNDHTVAGGLVRIQHRSFESASENAQCIGGNTIEQVAGRFSICAGFEQFAGLVVHLRVNHRQSERTGIGQQTCVQVCGNVAGDRCPKTIKQFTHDARGCRRMVVDHRKICKTGVRLVMVNGDGRNRLDEASERSESIDRTRVESDDEVGFGNLIGIDVVLDTRKAVEPKRQRQPWLTNRHG